MLACIGPDGDVGDLLDESGSESQSESGSESQSETDAGEESGSEGAGPEVVIHVRANDVPFDHQDGFAGQTPMAQAYGVTSLRLLDGRQDPEPQIIFDHGLDYVEASFAPGADTVVGSAVASTLPAASYDWARVGLSHVRIDIDATMHAMGLDIDGEFDVVTALAEGVEIDGEARVMGWWRYVFNAGAQSFPLEGTGGGPPLGVAPGATVEVVEEEGETALYFPVLLATDPTIASDVHIVMDFNVDGSFRWIDEDSPDFATGVFDTTSTTTEMIRRVGANDYEIYSE